MPDPTCPYCNGKAILRDSAFLYHGRAYGNVWVCEHYPYCDAYVGCHRRGDGDEPLGGLANNQLRLARKRAHAAFDFVFCSSTAPMSRSEGYRWLAKKLGIPEDACHIGMFDVAQCKRVREVMAEDDAPMPF